MTYWQWVRRYLAFHRRPTPNPSEEGNEKGGWRHPRSMGAPEVASFLGHLALAGNVAASTQNQALNALVFLYEHVLQIELGNIGATSSSYKTSPVKTSPRADLTCLP